MITLSLENTTVPRQLPLIKEYNYYYEEWAYRMDISKAKLFQRAWKYFKGQYELHGNAVFDREINIPEPRPTELTSRTLHMNQKPELVEEVLMFFHTVVIPRRGLGYNIFDWCTYLVFFYIDYMSQKKFIA